MFNIHVYIMQKSYKLCTNAIITKCLEENVFLIHKDPIQQIKPQHQNWTEGGCDDVHLGIFRWISYISEFNQPFFHTYTV